MFHTESFILSSTLRRKAVTHVLRRRFAAVKAVRNPQNLAQQLHTAIEYDGEHLGESNQQTSEPVARPNEPSKVVDEGDTDWRTAGNVWKKQPHQEQ